MSTREESESLLDKLDTIAPAPLKAFDAFPKLPSTYKERSESRGVLTLFVAFIAFLLVLNDIGEYVWGWPDYEFSVDHDIGSSLNINMDMVVNMPCRYLNVDLRDALGDRLYFSRQGFRRDGTKFDVGQATTFKNYQEELSARQAVAQSRKSRGLFDTILRRNTAAFKPTYNYEKDGSACRIYGTIQVKKVTANLHVTTMGHGYASGQHVDHKMMNLSHVITEFSFGPYFPEITQPLDYSFEIAKEPFTAYQYFLHVVPTTYVAPRSAPLNTNQYSVTHYKKVMDPDRGTPGIFFKFDLDPLAITVVQRTTSFIQLMIRCVGVIGGIFVCSGYAIRITSRAVSTMTGEDKSSGIVAAEATGTNVRRKWGGGELRARNASLGKVVRQGNSWVVEGGSPYSSYAGTPVSGVAPSPYLSSPMPSAMLGTTPVASPAPGAGFGLGFGSSFGPAPGSAPQSPFLGPPSSRPGPPPRTPSLGVPGSPYPASPAPGSAGFAHFPPTPNPASAASSPGFPRSPAPGASTFATQHGPSPRGGSAGGKKDD